ncbi:hypothetical protein DCC81_25220 [Chitinophaga parva]|uniref:6-bladed beta-propeller n=1 Tax=Chitinophaga parva TaxID=2169414 RepID=A0A2T7BB88_9BACT|nr:6-bladed beta-propeller [Chitinophaga parva]PUZ21311.1 hypothetical protein DCC81_25220 [Chitinophaga parva]
MNKMYLVAILLSLSCCRQKAKKIQPVSGFQYETISDNPDMRTIQADKINDSILLSSLISGFDFIKLDTRNDKTLFGEITDLKVTDQQYVVFDKLSSSVLAYDKAGRYLFSISAGEKDSLNISSIDGIDTYDSTLYVYNGKAKEILCFDMSGHFLAKRSLDHIFQDFSVINNKEDLLLNTNKLINYVNEEGMILHDCTNLYLVESRGKDNAKLNFTKRYFPFDERVYPNGSMRVYINHPFSHFAHTTYYTIPLGDTIYSIFNNGKLLPAYHIDFREKKSSFVFGEHNGQEVVEYLKKNPEGAYMVSNFFETANWVHFSYMYNSQQYTGLYSKQSQKVISGKIVNDIFGVNFTFFGSDQNAMIGTIKPFQVKQLAKRVSELRIAPSTGEHLVALANKLRDIDNEIIVRCKLNSF